MRVAAADFVARSGTTTSFLLDATGLVFRFAAVPLEPSFRGIALRVGFLVGEAFVSVCLVEVDFFEDLLAARSASTAAERDGFRVFDWPVWGFPSVRACRGSIDLVFKRVTAGMVLVCFWTVRVVGVGVFLLLTRAALFCASALSLATRAPFGLTFTVGCAVCTLPLSVFDDARRCGGAAIPELSVSRVN